MTEIYITEHLVLRPKGATSFCVWFDSRLWGRVSYVWRTKSWIVREADVSPSERKTLANRLDAALAEEMKRSEFRNKVKQHQEEI